MDDDLKDDKLTPKELLLARAAAKIALEELSNQFYREIGKTIVNRLLILLGMVVMGIAVGKGWITLKL